MREIDAGCGKAPAAATLDAISRVLAYGLLRWENEVSFAKNLANIDGISHCRAPDRSRKSPEAEKQKRHLDFDRKTNPAGRVHAGDASSLPPSAGGWCFFQSDPAGPAAYWARSSCGAAYWARSHTRRVSCGTAAGWQHR
jgi:hypothetical protein